MAQQGMFDWNAKDPQTIRQEYLAGIMGAKPSMGAQAGANIGYSLGRLFGGKAPQQVENELMKEVFARAMQATTDPVEGLKIAARGLREKGMEGRAIQLDQEAAKMAASMATQTAAQQGTAAKENALRGRAQFLLSRVEGLTPEMAMGLAGDEQVVRELLKQPDVKTEIVETEQGQLLINSQTGATIANIGRKPQKPSMGSEIASGLAPLVAAVAGDRAKKAAEAEGTGSGKNAVDARNGQNALQALADAKNIFNKGIYAGGYGPAQEIAAKYGMGVLGSQQRLSNTEQFRAFIGDVVIPRLRDFGGSDSNEELKYLKTVMAANTDLQPSAIQGILNRVDRAIKSDLARVKAQQEAVYEGRPVPVDVPKNTPRPTKRFNRETGKFEIIGG